MRWPNVVLGPFTSLRSSATGKGVLIASAILLAVGGIARDAGAWDGQRQGFVLGLAGGWGVIENWSHFYGHATDENPLYEDEYDRFDQNGFATDARVGWGINDRFVMHFSGRQLMLRNEAGLLVLPSAAVVWFLRPEAPSVSFHAGAGLTTDRGINDDRRDFLDYHVHAGVGYEMARHVSLELDLLRLGLGREYRPAGWAAMLSMAVTAY